MHALTHHWAGWFCLLIALLLPLAWPKLRRDRHLQRVVWLVLLVQIGIAVANAFWGPLPGSDDDAWRFLRDARLWAEHGNWGMEIGTLFYVEIVGFLFRLLQPSALLAGGLSIIASSLFMMVFIYLLNQLQVDRWRTLLLLAVGFWPSRLLLCSYPLKEPFQLLFLAVAIAFAVKAHQSQRLGWWGLSAFGCIGLGMLHHGLAVYACGLFPALAAWSLLCRGNRRLRLVLGISLPLLILLSWWLSQIKGVVGTETLRAVWAGKGLEYFRAYRGRLMLENHGAADYGLQVATDDWFSFGTSMVKIYFYFLFTPFLSMISKTVHWLAFVETGGRSVLLTVGLLGVVRSNQQVRQYQTLLFGIFFSLTFLWALGTANFGAAWRHHVLTNWLLLLLLPLGFGDVSGPEPVPEELSRA